MWNSIYGLVDYKFAFGGPYFQLKFEILPVNMFIVSRKTVVYFWMTPASPARDLNLNLLTLETLYFKFSHFLIQMVIVKKRLKWILINVRPCRNGQQFSSAHKLSLYRNGRSLRWFHSEWCFRQKYFFAQSPLQE